MEAIASLATEFRARLEEEPAEWLTQSCPVTVNDIAEAFRMRLDRQRVLVHRARLEKSSDEVIAATTRATARMKRRIERRRARRNGVSLIRSTFTFSNQYFP